MNLFKLDGIVSKLEFSKTASDMSLAKINLYQKLGKKKSYYNLIAFKDVADNINRDIIDNDLIEVECVITQNNYEKDGKKIYGYSFIINKYTLLKKAETSLPQPDETIPNEDYVPYDDIN